MKKLILILPLLISISVFGQYNTNKVSDSIPVGKKCMLGITSIFIENTKLSVVESIPDLFNFSSSSFENQGMNMGRHGRKSSMNSMMGISQITAGVGFSPYCKKLGDYNRKMELRFGLSFARGNWVASHNAKSDTKAGETYTSSNGTIQSDTLSLTTTNNFYEMNVLGLDISFLVRSNQEKSVSLFAGIGMNAGFSLTSDMKSIVKNTQDIVYNMNGYEISGPNNNYFSHVEKMEETVKGTAGSFLLRLYIPFGVDFRISKKRKLLDKLHIYLNGQFGGDYQQLTDGSKYYIRPSLGAGLGLKYKF